MSNAHEASRQTLAHRPGRPPVRDYLPLVFVVLFFATALQSWAQPISKEYQVKAAFLFNFTKFVDWPADRFESEKSPIVIAVLGRNPFSGELEKLVKGRSVHGRRIEVRFIASPDEARSAHIVFIPAAEDRLLNDALFSAPGILTVGESADFGSRGGIIRFALADEKVRFEINQTSGEKAGLKLSGQLLKLATLRR